MLQRYVALLRRLRLLARQQGAGPGLPDQAQRLAAAQVRACVSEACPHRKPCGRMWHNLPSSTVQHTT